MNIIYYSPRNEYLGSIISVSIRVQSGDGSGIVGRGRRPLASLYDMIRCESFMYVCDRMSLASTHFLWCPPTLFWTTPLGYVYLHPDLEFWA